MLRPFGSVTDEDIANEARAITKLCMNIAHDNIVHVRNHGWMTSPFSDYYFIDMEYCDKTLENHIADHSTRIPDSNNVIDEGRMGVIEAIQIVNDITHGLGFIHENNEVHRDLKPSNGTNDPFLVTSGKG